MSDFLDRLIRMENKIDKIADTLADAVTDIAINKQCYHNLYGALEAHKVEACNKVTSAIDTHETDEHKGLAGRILLYTSIILTSEGVIIGAVWYLATHIPK